MPDDDAGRTSYDPDLDGQRLAYHPEAVAAWLRDGLTTGPLYTELELTTVCPHACTFCGVDHLVNRQRTFLDRALAQRVFSELADCGNRSILVSGHGEPLMHPNAAEIIAQIPVAGMSAALTTNGILLDGHDLSLMDGLKWLRFSINGCDPQNYARIHRAPPRMFHRVFDNLALAVRRKRDRRLQCVIGVQLVLLEENAAGVISLARAVRDTGADYFSVKPYSQHPLATPRPVPDYRAFAWLEPDLRALETGEFRIHFRSESMRRVGRDKEYRRCYGTHFLAFVSADGGLWECNVFAGDPRFFIGDLTAHSVRELWKGPERRKVLRFLEEEMDLSECRDVCRMEACNRYLWRLKNPLAHDDFI